MTINEDRLREFVGRFASDLGAVLHASTVLVGDRLGLYVAMGDSRARDPSAACGEDGLPGALRGRVASRTGGQRLCGVRRGDAAVLAH